MHPKQYQMLVVRRIQRECTIEVREGGTEPALHALSTLLTSSHNSRPARAFHILSPTEGGYYHEHRDTPL